MNFQITKKSKPKQQKDVNEHLQFGLNERKAKKSKKSIFQADDSSSSSDEDENQKGRSGVNRSIRKEQNLVRNHVIMNNAQSNDKTLYDYDGEYESFTASSTTEKPKEKEKQKSRYITNLLKTAQQRQTEQEIIYEQIVAKEQDIEDSKEEYLNKEKFVTSAYKRKLEERNVWQQQDKEKTKKEEEDDVRKKGPEGAFFGFYGNMSKQKDSQNIIPSDDIEKETTNENGTNLLRENNEAHRNEYTATKYDKDSKNPTKLDVSNSNIKTIENDEVITRKEKLDAARKRYFERHPDLIPNES